MEPEALYRDIVEMSPDAIWVCDLDGRTLYANCWRPYSSSESKTVTSAISSALADRKSTRLNSSHYQPSRMPSSA